jgi:23S rRNA (cytosine1962-C5)-methyltransferase
MVGSLAAGKTVLDCFSYTGAFSVHALRGGASRVDSVERSAKAAALIKENYLLNGYDPGQNPVFQEDVFEFLRRPDREYDLLILDPPAFAKKKTDVVQACRAYKDINRLAFLRIRPRGLLLTFSCSHFVDESLFRKVVFQAGLEAGRNVRILQRHHQAFDHPVNVYHPETEYLKGFLLHVE